MNDQDVDVAGTDERRFFFACAKKKKKDVGILLSDQGMFFSVLLPMVLCCALPAHSVRLGT